MNWLTGGPTGEAKRLISQLTDSSKRERARQDLIKLGAEAVPALVEALSPSGTMQSRDRDLLATYQEILVQIGPAATAILAKAMGEAHPLVRGQICEIFGQTKDRAAIPTLLEALKGEFYTVRGKSARALADIGDKQAVQPILGLLKDKEAETRINAALALGQFNHPVTFGGIGDLLLDDLEIEVRQAAAKALSRTRNPAVLPYLMDAMRDSFWWYGREHAALVLLDAIESFGSFAVEPLIEALADKEGTVRRFAARILGNIKDPRAIEALGMELYDLNHEVGTAVALALSQIGPASYDVLEAAARHPEPGIRANVILALGKIKDNRVAPILLDLIRDPDRSVQKQAVLSLGELGDPRAVPVLLEISTSRTDREMAHLARQVLEKLQ
jgi:HEAT repeat protein